jgi:uridine phosphorylase
VGLTVTQANFYSTDLFPPPWRKYADYGALTVEMEMSALFVIARMNGARAGGILTSDGNLARDAEEASYDPHREIVTEGKKAMLEIALRALAKLREKTGD